MAEGFGSYHVPQQSRRDKLRVVSQNHPTGGCVDLSSSSSSAAAAAANLQGFFPLYDPSFLSSDLLTCNNTSCGGHAAVKQEFANMMGFVGAPSAAAAVAASSSPYFDPPQSSTFAAANPSSSNYQGFDTNNNNNNNPLVYSSQNIQNLRDFTHSYNSGELIVFKPETPLSLVNNKDSNAAAGSTATVQGGLSLSLSSHYGQSHYGHQQSNNLPLELNLQRYGSSSSSVYGDKDADHEGFVVPQQVPGCASLSNYVSRSLVPLGPFTGYASVLKESRFLKPAQQLLEEFCNVGVKVDSSTLMDRQLMQGFTTSEFGDNSHSSGDGVGQPRKSRLLLMLEEVYRRYKQYYQQMQAALASFEYVPGLGNAAPYAHMALKTMCKHFTSLKNAITDQLQFTSKAESGHMSHRKDEDPTYGNTNKSIHGQRFIEQQPVWRPQRGLPERAVTILRAWLFEHFLHPYPTDTDKLMLAKQTGLSRNQVSNWFINARVRLWKPMVEEIHMLESRQAQKVACGEEQNSSRRNENLFSGKPLASENLSTSDQRMHGIPSPHNRNEFPDVHVGNQGQLNLSYNISNHAQGNANANIGGASGVSLTLGLHQNNGIGLSEPFPVNAPQRFGTNLDPEANHGFGLQNQHIGGQLLHDFVG